MGFLDLQVNGYAGVDFNGDELDAERVGAACARLESEGVEGILVTMITDSLAAMEARLRAVVKLRESVPSLRRIMRGFHIEGPFLNPAEGYRGAHPADAVMTGDVSAMQRLLDAAEGLARVVTLAPERIRGWKLLGCWRGKTSWCRRDIPMLRWMSYRRGWMLDLVCLRISGMGVRGICRGTITF